QRAAIDRNCLTLQVSRTRHVEFARSHYGNIVRGIRFGEFYYFGPLIAVANAQQHVDLAFGEVGYAILTSNANEFGLRSDGLRDLIGDLGIVALNFQIST